MKKFLVFLMIAGLLTVGGGIASADLLVDRGLPTSNLNNSAGSSRSNVAWADWETTNPPSEYWLPGDDVVLTDPGTYHIDTIRVWSIKNDTGFSLLAGSDVNHASIFSTYTSTKVTYTDASDYQGSSGTPLQIYQLDFAINETVTSGKYYFFLDGPWIDNRDGGFVNPFLHASNAALSGSTQDGSDDYFQWLHIKNGAIVGIESWLSTGGGTTGWGAGWDKNSDANVQVYGARVPEPATMLLLSSGLIGLAGFRRKFKKV
jgi:hypothetical protein